MKNRYTLLFLVPLLLILLSCNKDDDKPVDPVDLLPEATQTGVGTFGCLINGQVFIPSGTGLGGPSLDCVYQNVDGEFYFALKGSRRNNSGLQSIGLLTEKLEIQENVSYFLSQKADGNASGAYWYSPQYIYIYIYFSKQHR